MAGPPHTHSREDDVSYILEREIDVLIGDDLIHAAAGSYVFKPRNLAHTFWNPGANPARILEFITPAGLERYFEDVAPAFKPNQPPDAKMIVETAPRYGLQIHVEKLGELSAKHGITLPGGPPQL